MVWNKFFVVVDLCFVCQRENESIIHALVECDFARQCWSSAFQELRVVVAYNFQHWLEHKIVDINRRAEIATLCWAIWKARNELVWNHRNSRVHMVFSTIKNYLVQ